MRKKKLKDEAYEDAADLVVVVVVAMPLLLHYWQCRDADAVYKWF